MNISSLAERCGRASSLLVATDFDGTLAPIVPSPAAARAAPGALEQLAALAAMPSVHVAVVSGRSADDLRTRIPIPAYRVSEHGAFVERPDGSCLEGAAEVGSAAIDELEAVAQAVGARFQGVRIERKRTTVAVHVREAVDPKGALRALEPFRRAAMERGLSVLDGRQIVEARACARTKADGLALVLAELPRETLVVYAGDDTTDESAIQFARERGGVGVYIRSSERPRSEVEADLALDGIAPWIEALEAMLEARRRGEKITS